MVGEGKCASLFTQKGFQTRSLSSDNDRRYEVAGGGRGGSTPLTDLLQQLLHCCTGCQMQDASWKLGAAGCCRIEASSRSCIFMHLVQLERVLS